MRRTPNTHIQVLEDVPVDLRSELHGVQIFLNRLYFHIPGVMATCHYKSASR
jgi:hypothetical protein